jgi:ribosomal protein S12 methylthiotransferase
VLEEASQLVSSGAVELNVIAQDTTAWGSDLAGELTLAELLRELDTLDGLEWIRLMYTYPRRFTDELIQVIANAQRVVPYLDMPLQHISDDVLRRMGRGVSQEKIRTLLTALRDRIDGLQIRTTFIVGFPGETDGDFQRLLDFVEEFRFDALGVFEFSPEPETPAARMPGQVSDKVKADRHEQLMLAQQRITMEDNESLTGMILTVLVDGLDTQGRCIGRHYGQAPEIDSICILTEPAQPGEFVSAEVMGSHGYDLIVAPVSTTSAEQSKQ